MLEQIELLGATDMGHAGRPCRLHATNSGFDSRDGGQFMPWSLSHRADPASVAIADRHYNRQKPGTPQFVPPGRCFVLRSEKPTALWVTSWPFAEYVKHDWPGAWINSCFRKEGEGDASQLILAAIAATRMFWTPPPLGLVTFVDPRKTPGVMRRGQRVHGYCYLRAGFKHVGFTKGDLWAWQLLPHDMPSAAPPRGMQATLFGALPIHNRQEGA